MTSILCRLLLGLSCLIGPGLSAAEITLLGSQAVSALLEELGPAYEQASGDKLRVVIGVSNNLKNEIEAGAPFDVTILSAAMIDELEKDGKLAAGSRRDLARSGIGLAVRAGAAKPDLSSAESLKKTLLAADGVAFVNIGASGVYFRQMIQDMGIGEAMEPKLHPLASGRAAELVARGEAQYAIQQISEILPVKGAELVGPLPPELQLYTIFSGAIGKEAKNPAGAKALLDFLAAPERAPVIRTKGMEPG